MIGQLKKPPTLKVGIRWLIGSGVLALVGLGGGLGYFKWLDRAAEPVMVRSLTIEPGTVETTLNESGILQLAGQQTLKSPVEGAVETVLVAPGDRVEMGQVLVVLRNPERQTVLEKQQLNIERQQIMLDLSRQQIVNAQAQLVADEDFLQRLTMLAQDGAVAQKDVQTQTERIRATRSVLLTAETDARTALLELESLRLERQRIQQELQDTTITAPISGVVLGVDVKNGDGVERRTDLLTLGNPAQELVQLQLSTLNAAQVRVNQRARVSVIGPDSQLYMGHVEQLYPQAVSGQEQSQRDRARGGDSGQPVVPTTVKLDRPTRSLIPGSQVNVEIILEQRQNVITVPIEAIQPAPNGAFVWVMDGTGEAQRQPITPGLEGLTSVEVTAGLKVGDRVIIPSPDTVLEPGMPVMPQSLSPAAPIAPAAPADL